MTPLRSIIMTGILTVLSCYPECFATSQPIDEVFPSLASKSLGINFISNNIGELETYQICRFEGDEINRNHFDSRQGSGIVYLVMHYTVCNFPEALGLFTKNVPENRVSAHYVISETEPGIKSGQVIQVVPDEERAWHAGVSY